MIINIVPTVTASTPEEYKYQLDRVARFAQRVHIDLSDGKFSPHKLVDVETLWWPQPRIIDIHMMHKKPAAHIRKLCDLQPSMVILHAESDGNFYDMARPLHAADIRVGLAVLAETPVSAIASVIDVVDHVLIFGGKLGYFGGTVDQRLFHKVRDIKKLRTDIEIGWDGGVNDETIRSLIELGVDVLNVGGYIQHASEPETAYDTLVEIAQNVRER